MTAHFNQPYPWQLAHLDEDAEVEEVETAEVAFCSRLCRWSHAAIPGVY